MDTSEFTDEQIEALQALADGYNDQSVSRRDVMKLVGAGGVGALLGGGGAMAATEPASAGTAQSGQLGTPADRVDVFGEDVDSKSVTTDKQITGEAHTLGPNDSLPDVVANRSESIFDLAGRTYEVSSLWTVSRDDVKVKNGTVKLADGADSDFVEINANGITLKDITFDFNGSNNSGSGGSGFIWDSGSGALRMDVVDCDFINNQGRGDGRTLRIGSIRRGVRGCTIKLEGADRVDLVGQQCRYIDNTLRSNGEIKIGSNDNQLIGNQIVSNNVGVRMGGGTSGDWLVALNIIEDNNVGLLADTSQSDNHTTNVVDNHFQGNTEYAVYVTPGSLTGTNAEFALLDNTYKMNGADNNGNGTGQIEIDGGDGLTVRPAQMTSKTGSSGMADIGVNITSNATGTVLEWYGYDNADFDTAAIVDNGSSTELVHVPGNVAVLEKTASQSLTASTNNTIDWDNQDLDGDLYTYDSSNDTVEVGVSGDYRVDGAAWISGVADQDLIEIQITVNGSIVRRARTWASGTDAGPQWGVVLKDLSAQDTIGIDIYPDSASTLEGNAERCYAMISKDD